MIRIKRIYDSPDKSDGYRVLVDRLWPRSVSKEKAALDDWQKNAAPSPGLRGWFGHDPKTFDEFSELYADELKTSPDVDTLLDVHHKHNNLTLLYAAKDPAINHAAVL